MSYTDTDPLLIQGLPPPLEQRRILLELPVSPLPQIGTDRKIAVAYFPHTVRALVAITVLIPPTLLHTSQLISKRKSGFSFISFIFQ